MTAAHANDIVVLARRLDSLSVLVGRDTADKLTCSLSQSTGRAGLDRALCRTAAQCVGKGAVDQAAVSRCIDRRKPELLSEVRRKAGRAAAP